MLILTIGLICLKRLVSQISRQLPVDITNGVFLNKLIGGGDGEVNCDLSILVFGSMLCKYITESEIMFLNLHHTDKFISSVLHPTEKNNLTG